MKLGYFALVIAAGLGVMFLTGCAGRVYLGWEPTDTVTESRTMEAGKTIWCRVFGCESTTGGTEK